MRVLQSQRLSVMEGSSPTRNGESIATLARTTVIGVDQTTIGDGGLALAIGMQGMLMCYDWGLIVHVMSAGDLQIDGGHSKRAQQEAGNQTWTMDRSWRTVRDGMRRKGRWS